MDLFRAQVHGKLEFQTMDSIGGNHKMSNQSNDVPRRKQFLDKESSFRQKIWKLWLVIFAAGLAAAFSTSLSHASLTPFVT
jgi:hypothetical protein